MAGLYGCELQYAYGILHITIMLFKFLLLFTNLCCLPALNIAFPLLKCSLVGVLQRSGKKGERLFERLEKRGNRTEIAFLEDFLRLLCIPVKTTNIMYL